MTDHFAAFSFVDRITALTPGKRARGTFAIPPDVDGFPPCLMAEAVGQLKTVPQHRYDEATYLFG